MLRHIPTYRQNNVYPHIFEDALRILENPEQYLDPADKTSQIKIRALAPPIRAVRFHSDTAINVRMVKKSLKGIETESCTMMGDSKCDVVVTFKHAEGKHD